MSEREPTWYQRLGQSGRKLTLAQRYYERGLDYFAKKKWKPALADLDEALELEPDNAEYYITRGLILLQQDEDDEAEIDFADGLRLDRTQWLAHYGRGIIAFKQENYQTAIDQFSRAQHVAPERPEVYFYRAVAFHEMGNSAEAVRDMEFAQRLIGDEDARHSQTQKWLKVFNEALAEAGP